MPKSKSKATRAIRIGMSGWTYAPWRGTFYPKGVSQKNELKYASSVLSSIEINGTFYSLQRPTTFASWYEQTPEGFVFSLTAPRFITHIRRLRDIKAPLANFMLSGVLRLNDKLGPILWQFPPNMKWDAKLFEAFFKQLPRTTREAAKLLKNSDGRIKGRSFADIDRDRPMRHAVEIRHESFATKEFIEMLGKHQIALVIADAAEKNLKFNDVTADFLYLRLHGAAEVYPDGYTEEALDQWAKKIRTWAKQRDVFVYFDTEIKVHSPFDATRLSAMLGLRHEPAKDAG